MHLTTRTICELHASVLNLEQSPDAFCALLHPDVHWFAKWNPCFGRTQVEKKLLDSVRFRRRYGLSQVELLSGYVLDDESHVDCTVSVSADHTARYYSYTTFGTDGHAITSLSNHGEGPNAHWPYPERAIDKLGRLIINNIPIAPLPDNRPLKKLIWPDDGRNYVDLQAEWGNLRTRNM